MARPAATPLRTLATGLMATPGKRPLDGEEAAGALHRTLRDLFGFASFRHGQQEVIEAALAGRDTAVFWATGSGKSLCYQLPALHCGRVVVVVSPLISLMLDQVTKFNATVGAAAAGVGAYGAPKACFLGSAQFDPEVERGALRGDYKLVYVTPEKLTAGGLLGSLRMLFDQGKLALLAVDEAHCISEWGHDFRPSYRELRAIRREVPGLPIMALTATAVPRVRSDILQQLDFSNTALVSQSSFDRPNLVLSCRRKTSKANDLAQIARTLAQDDKGATIVYVPTQAETETVANYLSERLAAAGLVVRCYHGGMAPGLREDAHVDFLSGRANIIVATVAFGMGIDKPDIRRIIHYGPPKTVEEYIQQVGRAGRDGLEAYCELITSDSDFSNYASDFYTRGLTAEAKEGQLRSTEKLREYAASVTCRRAWLLRYLGEEPLFESCGTCDNSRGAAAHKDDLTRDFRQPAALVLEAVAATEDFPQALTSLLQIISGTYKPKGASAGGDRRRLDAMARIQDLRFALPPLMRSEAFTREMVSMLCASSFLERRRVSASVGGGSYQNNFDVYVMTEKGRSVYEAKDEVRLPVPQSIRQQEEAERRRQEERKQELQTAGVDLKKIPVKELEDGEGQTVSAHLTWIRRLKSLRERGLNEKAEKLEEVRKRILAWREGVAQKLRIAPADALAEHLALSIAYAQPTSLEALRAAGVRVAGVEDLAALMQKLVQELFPKGLDEAAAADGASAPNGGAAASAALMFPQGPWQAAMKWQNAIYKVGKGGKLPIWEQYYNRWAQGEHMQAIALAPPGSGKAVRVQTIAGHILTAVQFGKPVDLPRAVQECEVRPPNKQEWDKLEEAAAIRGVNVDAEDYNRKEVLCGILGAENVNRDPTTKSESDKAQEDLWYGKMGWWVALKRVRFPASFAAGGDVAGAGSGDAKRQRVA